MGNPDEFEAANRRARLRDQSTPKAVRAHYDRRTDRVVITLSNRVDLAFSPRDAQGLEGATAAQLSKIEISPTGLGLHFPRIDADLFIPGILEGLMGSKKWMASRLGANGGKSKSDAKRDAAKRNGRLGGRPRKRAAA